MTSLRPPAPQDWKTFRAQLVALQRSGGLPTVPDAGSAASTSAPAPPPPRAVRFCPTSWAHAIPAPEAGCLLVATPNCGDFFSQAVVLITSHGALPLPQAFPQAR